MLNKLQQSFSEQALFQIIAFHLRTVKCVHRIPFRTKSQFAKTAQKAIALHCSMHSDLHCKLILLTIWHIHTKRLIATSPPIILRTSVSKEPVETSAATLKVFITAFASGKRTSVVASRGLSSSSVWILCWNMLALWVRIIQINVSDDVLTEVYG